MNRPLRIAAALLLSTLLGSAPLTLAGPASASAPGDICTPARSSGNALATELGMDQVRAAVGRRPLPKIALVDGGAVTNSLLPGVRRWPTTLRTPGSESGTLAAATIAGARPIGLLPGAQLSDVPVFTAEQEVTAANLRTGLTQAMNAVGAGGVISVSVGLPVNDAGVRAALAEAAESDIVVVAAIQPRTTTDATDEQPRPESSWPAALPGVLGVGIDPGDGDVGAVYPPSEDLDVVAPVLGALSLLPGGRGACELQQATSAIAAAEVTALAALLRAQRPGDTAAQVVARITETASGAAGVHSTTAGYGRIQPVEALRRELDISAEGKVSGASRPELTVPGYVPPPDGPAPASRERLLWWVLLGGGALGAAVLARPLIKPRR